MRAHPRHDFRHIHCIGKDGVLNSNVMMLTHHDFAAQQDATKISERPFCVQQSPKLYMRQSIHPQWDISVHNQENRGGHVFSADAKITILALPKPIPDLRHFSRLHTPLQVHRSPY